MGQALSRLAGQVEGGALAWPWGRRAALARRLGEESARVGQLTSRVAEMAGQLRVREDQVGLLTTELERQREVREALAGQVARSAEERAATQQQAGESRHILREIELLKEKVVRPEVVTAPKIGEQGEEWVVEALQAAFPTNTSIARTSSPHSGDIVMRLENTGKTIMIEVKALASGAVSGRSGGAEIDKFYRDLRACGADGGVLVALSGPVDPATRPLTPLWADSRPCLYVDCLRTQYPDPVCLLRVVVHMMAFLMDMGQKEGQREGFHIKVKSYLQTVKILSTTYQKLYKSNEGERRALEQMKSSLDTLQRSMVRDQEASEAREE